MKKKQPYLSNESTVCILDIETDSLSPKVIWVAGVKDLQTGKKYFFERPDLCSNDLEQTLLKYDFVCGHNIISFDLPNLYRLSKIEHIPLEKIIDTLVLSRMINFNQIGGHSAESWGERLGQLKIPPPNFLEGYTEKMRVYLDADLDNHEQIFLYFKRFLVDPDWFSSISIEHFSAWSCHDIHVNGFQIDIDLLQEVFNVVSSELKTLDDYIKENAPKNSKGEDFNPGSPKQRVDLFWDYNWKPTEKTKGHLDFLRSHKKDPEKREKFLRYGWTTSEENLATLPNDTPLFVTNVVQWIALSTKKSRLTELLNAYNPETGRIHGSYNFIGAWTHRKSHNKPNQANLPSPWPEEKEAITPVEIIHKKYNHFFRKFFKTDTWLVGTDADAIQLCILAHLMKDEEYIFAVTKGDKKDGTDVHNVNRRALGLSSITRDDAKTFIYAWLLGAQRDRVASILRVQPRVASMAMVSFLNSLPKLRELKENQIPTEYRQGFFVGLDGRKVMVGHERLVLAGHLQCNESIIMKHAEREWRKELEKLGIRYRLVNDVHDEWQTEVCGTEEEARMVGKVQSDALSDTGLLLGCMCPISGSYKLGHTWFDTH